MNPVSAIASNASQSSPTQVLQSAAAASSVPSTGVPPADLTGETNGPSVTVDLSQDAKTRLAQANENQAAANRILAFVDAGHSKRSDHSGNANDSWSTGEPSLAEEYQQLTGNSSQTSDEPQASQNGTVTITLSASSEASVSLEFGSGAAAISASAASSQYNSVSLSVNVNTGSIELTQSDQSLIEMTAQIGSAPPVSITA
jgi:hypothetical protein